MRIALIAPPWAPVPPLRYGGIELVVDLLARGYQAAGHDVVLFATGDSSCPVPTSSIIERADWTTLGQSMVELRHVLHAHGQLAGFDVVHDHTIAGPLLASRIPDVPLVATMHGDLRGELADVYRASTGAHLVAISHAQARDVDGIEPARVIHHGVESARFPVGDGGGGYHAFLGRMCPEKGAHRAIAAARAAGERLLLAGKIAEPLEKAYFASAIEPLLGPDVQYVGELGHEDKVALLGGARSLLFPIRWPEPFGLVMIEALACGTPVIAFPEGSAPEVVEDGRTGFLCADTSAMSRAITRIDEIDRATCRQAVDEYFCVERMVDEHLQLFERLTAPGGHYLRSGTSGRADLV